MILVHFSYSKVIHLVYLIKHTFCKLRQAYPNQPLFFLPSLDTIQAVVLTRSDLLQFSAHCLYCVAADYYKFKC